MGQRVSARRGDRVNTTAAPDQGDDADSKQQKDHQPGTLFQNQDAPCPPQSLESARLYIVGRRTREMLASLALASRPLRAEDATSPLGLIDTKTELHLWLDHLSHEYRIRATRRPLISPRSLPGAAVFLAGKKRSAVRDEWRSHLSGPTGRGLAWEDQVRAARGFLWSAVRFRLHDAADLMWRPIDAVLGSRILSNLFVWGPVFVVLIAIVRHDGRYGLVADVQDPIELGLFLYAAVKVGRWYRKVKPPEPRAWSARE
jgi:hypothetical protein